MPEITDERLAELENFERNAHTLRSDRVRFELSRALSAASCRADGVDDACFLLASQVAPEFDVEGRITSLTIGENRYESVGDAASAFLKARPHFVAAAPDAKSTPAPTPPAPPKPATGTGLIAGAFGTTPAPISSTIQKKESLDAMREAGHSPSEFIARALNEPPRK